MYHFDRSSGSPGSCARPLAGSLPKTSTADRSFDCLLNVRGIPKMRKVPRDGDQIPAGGCPALRLDRRHEQVLNAKATFGGRVNTAEAMPKAYHAQYSGSDHNVKLLRVGVQNVKPDGNDVDFQVFL